MTLDPAECPAIVLAVFNLMALISDSEVWKVYGIFIFWSLWRSIMYFRFNAKLRAYSHANSLEYYKRQEWMKYDEHFSHSVSIESSNVDSPAVQKFGMLLITWNEMLLGSG